MTDNELVFGGLSYFPPFPYRVSDSANIKPEEVRGVEVVVVSSNLDKVRLLAPDSVEFSVVTNPLLRVPALLLLPLLLGEHVEHLGLIDLDREDMCGVVDWSEVLDSSRNRNETLQLGDR